MRKTRMLHRAFNWAFLLLSLTLLFRLGGAWHNSLQIGHVWESEKVSREDLPGAIEFMTSPATLRGETLRIGNWLGHQRIHTKEFIQAPKSGELRFDLRLGRDSFVVVSFLDEHGDHPFALRLSRSARFPSAVFKIQQEEFLEKKNIDDLKLSSGYSTIFLRWTPEKSELQVDHDHLPLHFSLPNKFQLAFAGGADSADALKNIRLHEMGKQKSVFHEYFLPQYGKSLTALLFCIFVLLVAGTGFLSERNRFLTNLVVLVLLFGAVLLNERVLLPRAASLALLREAKPIEILGNQEQLTVLLSSVSDGRQLAIGLESTLREETKKLWHVVTKMQTGVNPSVLLIGVSAEDEASCADLLAAAKVNYPKSKRLFIEMPNETLSEKVALKREEDCLGLAKTEKIPFLNARQSLEDKADTGFLWWDHAHLTKRGMNILLSSLGKSLAAYVAH